MKLDSVLTVAIGRNGSDGNPMDEQRWASFGTEVAGAITSYCGTIVANTEGAGVGSDGVNEEVPEDSRVIVAINVPRRRLDSLRGRVASIIGKYEQGSAAFAIDMAHEPVFSTEDGYRK